MSEDQTTQQMLLLEDSPANHSALQEKEKEQQMIAISGMKLLESLPNANRAGLLGKMLKDLLTSTTAWSSDRCKLIWKSKVSKSNVLLFQLQASVLGIKGKESGLWLTPTATDIATRSDEALQKRKEYRKSIGRTTTPPGNLAEQVQYGKPTTNMYPTPVVSDHSPETIEKWKQRQEIKKKQGINLHFKLCHHVQMYPTPRAQEPGRTKEGYGRGLAELMEGKEQIKMYPTPTTQEIEHPKMTLTKTGRRISKDGKNSHSLNLADTVKMYPTPTAGCRGRGTEFKNRDDREGWFYSKEEKQTRDDIRSKVIGCDDIPGKATIQHTNSERCEELNISQKSNGQNFCSGEFNSTETIKTWWQTQSEFCGVPNGVSYELDKDRSSRIKALGNSIVPQIARQIGLSIMKGELTNNE
jgi:hypothetical protein